MGKEGKRKRRHYRVHLEREEAHRAGVRSIRRQYNRCGVLTRPFRSFSITYLVWAWARTPWKHPGRPSLPSRLTLGPEGEKGVIGK